MSFSSVCMRVTPLTMYVDEFVRVLVEFPAIAAGEKLRVTRDRAQRLLKIVRSNVGELPQFVVHSGQFARPLLDPSFEFGIQPCARRLQLAGFPRFPARVRRSSAPSASRFFLRIVFFRQRSTKTATLDRSTSGTIGLYR